MDDVTVIDYDAPVVPSDEEIRVIAWRMTTLAQAGYDDANTVELALNHDVDLHRATDLLRRGCTPDLAVRILL